jgi:hypothetical protein
MNGIPRSWGIALLFQSMTFAVLYQRGMMTVGAGTRGVRLEEEEIWED